MKRLMYDIESPELPLPDEYQVKSITFVTLTQYTLHNFYHKDFVNAGLPPQSNQTQDLVHADQHQCARAVGCPAEPL